MGKKPNIGKCSQMNDNDIVKCQFCHKYFKQKSKNDKFCSSSCYIKYIKGKKRGDLLIEKICPVCKRPFKTNNNRKKYCSEKCCRLKRNIKSSERRRLQKEDKAIKELNVYLKEKEPKPKHKSEIDIIVRIAAEQKVSAGLVRAYYPNRLKELYKIAEYKRIAKGNNIK